MNKTEQKTLFITGITGSLGKEILKKLLFETNHRLLLLVRSKKDLSSMGRVEKIIESFNRPAENWRERITVFDGDITQQNLGLGDYDLQRIKREAEELFHVAALTALNGSEEDCFKINLGGTETVLNLAKKWHQKGALRRFFYFSTAYAAGSLKEMCSKEDELPSDPEFANFYEASKYASETKVREFMAAGLPTTIFRPSIVVGHSETGAVTEFNVIYPFMKMFAHGIITQLPTEWDHSFNIVPIDFVVNAAIEIAGRKDSIGKAYHLVTLEPPTIGLLLEMKEKEYPHMPHVEVVDPNDFKPEKLGSTGQMVFQMMKPYLGYLNGHLTFDASNSLKALRGTGVEFPKTDYRFLKTLTSYAIEAGYLLV